MPIRLIHIAFFFFFLTALSGVWMRINLFSSASIVLPFEHVLHAHSHMAILGWTFFSVFIIFVALMNQQRNKFVSRLTIILFIVTIAMFIAFLMQGYALYSIIFSTLHIFLEYAVAYFMIKHVRKKQSMPKSSRLFIYGSVIMLVISSMGPFALGGIASQGLQDSPLFEMAIYFYLHFQYNGWLYLVLIGMLLFVLHKRNVQYNEKLMIYSFWFYFFGLFPGYLLTVLWYGFGTTGIILAAIGVIGQLTGIVLFILSIFQAQRRFKHALSTLLHGYIMSVLVLLGLKGILEIGLLHPSFGQLIYDTRSVVVAYLHLTLLGFISLFILILFYMTKWVDLNSRFAKWGLSIFIIGLILNELTLFLSALFSWLRLGSFPGQSIVLLFASICLVLAVCLFWGATFNRQKI